MFDSSWPAPAQPSRRRSRRTIVAAISVFLGVAIVAASAFQPTSLRAARSDVRIFMGAATSLDPAIQADVASAQIDSQLFESLTAVDASQQIQPALAASWETIDSGRRIVFHLRPDLKFSNGSPIAAKDVVASWMRVLAMADQGGLASLLDDVVGAEAYAKGSGPASGVGLHAPDDATVQVDLASPASDFAAIASSPTLAVVPPGLDSDASLLKPGSFVGSGAYVLSAITATEATLVANPRYWAGVPALATVHVVNDIGGQSPVDVFLAGKLDYTPIPSFDGTWIAYDRTLGPSLRLVPSASVEYYGFDTTKPPFSDVHVRRAFAMAIDWRRIVTLLGSPTEVPATGMVPPGIPGRSSTDFVPKFDVAAAKAELAQAGFPNGVGFPKITLVTPGGSVDRAIAAQLHANLGVDIGRETMGFATYYQRLAANPPAFWEQDWQADYPGAYDFLGLLLGTGKANNYGHWSNASFDAALGKALSAADAASTQAAFDQAQAIVQDQVPVIPVDNGTGYWLAATGLLGAAPNGQGLVRFAGLAWAS
jgi:oligopeptide transport system substrate-binding protein